MTFDELTRNIMPHLPGAIAGLIKSQLKAAAARFCRDTHAWIEEVPVFIPAGMTHVEIDSNEDYAKPLSVISVGDLRSGADYSQSSANTLDLRSSYAENKVFTARVAYYMDSTATELPEPLVMWSEAIEHYAIFTMAMMPNKEWSNPQLAELHYKLWLEQVHSAKQKRALGFQSGSSRVKARPFV